MLGPGFAHQHISPPHDEPNEYEYALRLFSIDQCLIWQGGKVKSGHEPVKFSYCVHGLLESHGDVLQALDTHSTQNGPRGEIRL